MYKRREERICASLFFRILRKSSSIMSTATKHTGSNSQKESVLGTILKSWVFICIIDQIICKTCHLLFLSSKRKQKKQNVTCGQSCDKKMNLLLDCLWKNHRTWFVCTSYLMNHCEQIDLNWVI